MSTENVKRVLRPQNFVVIVGMGMLSVATCGLAASAFGGALPFAGELASATLGIVGGVKAVLANA